MKLNVNELKKFKPVAGTIRNNNILPITNYLKFDGGVIVKTNLHSFVSMDTDCEDSFLVDEKILFSFIESVSAKEIDVEVNEKNIILSCGKEKIISPTDKAKLFPVVSDSVGEEVELNEGILEQIKIASLFTEERENLPVTSSIFIGRGLIAASTGFAAYTHPIDESIPEIVLDKNTASAIVKFNSVFFSQNNTYQFFRNGAFKFGFAKKEIGFTNMKPFSILPEGNKVEIDKSEILSFCDTCVNSCQGKPLVAVAKFEGDKLIMNHAAYEIDYEKPLTQTFENFVFNPAILGRLLKSLPDEKVTFVKNEGKYFITGEGGYVCLIMEMKLLNQQ